MKLPFDPIEFDGNEATQPLAKITIVLLVLGILYFIGRTIITFYPTI